MFTADRIGEPMRTITAMQRDEAKVFFSCGASDLTVISRSTCLRFGSGADWLYTYLRGFCRKPSDRLEQTRSMKTSACRVCKRTSGRTGFTPEVEQKDDDAATDQGDHPLEPGRQKLSGKEYDKATADLVSIWYGWVKSRWPRSARASVHRR